MLCSTTQSFIHNYISVLNWKSCNAFQYVLKHLNGRGEGWGRKWTDQRRMQRHSMLRINPGGKTVANTANYSTVCFYLGLRYTHTHTHTHTRTHTHTHTHTPHPSFIQLCPIYQNISYEQNSEWFSVFQIQMLVTGTLKSRPENHAYLDPWIKPHGRKLSFLTMKSRLLLPQDETSLSSFSVRS